jgi:hypothetical protein
MVILSDVFDWINLAQKRLQWRDLVKTAMSLLLPKDEEKVSSK